MNSSERIDYLIKTLEGNNAKQFADRAGISTSAVSRIRRGFVKLDNYVDRICAAYPAINRRWLMTGSGATGIDVKKKSAEEYEEEIKYLKGLVKVLSKELKQNQAVIGKLLNP